MLDIINFLSAASGTRTVTIDVCDGQLLWILKVVRIVIRVISIAAPFALIIFGSLDFFKAIIAGDEKEMKAKRKPFIGRLVAAIIILLLPGIIDLLMKTIAGDDNSFSSCWTKAKTTGSVDIPGIDY